MKFTFGSIVSTGSLTINGRTVSGSAVRRDDECKPCRNAKEYQEQINRKYGRR